MDAASAEEGDLFRFWAEFMEVRRVVRQEDATFNDLFLLLLNNLEQKVFLN